MKTTVKEENTFLNIGSKPQIKSKLRALSDQDFKKTYKLLTTALDDIKFEKEEAQRIASEKQTLIEEQLQKMSSQLGIPLTDIKAHLNKI